MVRQFAEFVAFIISRDPYPDDSGEISGKRSVEYRVRAAPLICGAAVPKTIYHAQHPQLEHHRSGGEQ